MGDDDDNIDTRPLASIITTRTRAAKGGHARAASLSPTHKQAIAANSRSSPGCNAFPPVEHRRDRRPVGDGRTGDSRMNRLYYGDNLDV
jgi:hypothetical protein